MTDDTRNTKERIGAIPGRASVLGIDAKGRVHLHKPGTPHEVWVVVDGACEHYENLGDASIASWIEYTETHVGWRRRHHVERGAFEGLFDGEPTPPTRAEVGV